MAWTELTRTQHSRKGDGYLAAIINFRLLANAVWTTDEAVRRLQAG